MKSQRYQLATMAKSNQVVLVSGGASGIGEATCRKFAAAGYAVVIADINEVGGKKLEAEILSRQEEATFIKLDVTSESSWEHAVQQIVEKYGILTHLINNAGGTGQHVGIGEATLADFQKVFALTGTSVFLGCRVAGPALLRAAAANKNAAVVNVSSIISRAGNPSGDDCAYAAAKGACESITRNIALGWANKGVRVNSIHPGFIDTPLLKDLPKPFYNELVSKHPIGRLGTAAEIAEVIYFMASPAASFMVGSAIFVDGGYTAQ